MIINKSKIINQSLDNPFHENKLYSIVFCDSQYYERDEQFSDIKLINYPYVIDEGYPTYKTIYQ